MRMGNTIAHGRPPHTAGLYLVSMAIAAADLVISGTGDWYTDADVALPWLSTCTCIAKGLRPLRLVSILMGKLAAWKSRLTVPVVDALAGALDRVKALSVS